MTDSATETQWGEIDGRPITFPMEVEDLDSFTMLLSVPADAAQALLPGDAFEVIATDRTAQMVISCCDYQRNPWGDYLEINLGFLARPAGAGDEVVGSFIYRMPVDQAFTCRAGNEVMGFPKTVEDLSVEHGDDRIRFAWHQDGALVLAISFAPGEESGDGGRAEASSYSYLDGVPHETPLAMEMGTGVVDPASVVIEVGTGPVADELRTLGLPKRPDDAGWGTGLSATFQLGRPLR